VPATQLDDVLRRVNGIRIAHQRAYGRVIDFKPSLGDFVRAVDAGRFPELLRRV
jgi:hypothetical protein